MIPTPEAVEAAVKAIAEHVHNVPVLYGDASEDYIGGIQEAATAALIAAMPHLTVHPAQSVTDDLPNMVDIPLAWEVVRATKPEHHHPKCSYRTEGMLCDCALNQGLVYLSAKFEALTAQRGAVVPEIPACVHRIAMHQTADGWRCWVTMDITPVDAKSWTGVGADPWAALTAAVNAPREAGTV